ncbi:TetR/AcrR family transcriptional regulator [Rothia uropygioeca]|uniref:TetR/AcrR family transcriptional regulator n=1 Tax=Kocuria sp. 257 TaxID=2021970 RepID=UPI0013EAD894|nr:TetR/AcrR family transcriptional regulator [Kocuria sp. 257]
MNTKESLDERKDDSAPASSLDGRVTRWDTHRRVRRRQLLREARKAIHKLGPQASMEEIAQHSGTSKSVFYRYFTDKAGLSQALGEFLLAGIEPKIAEAARSGSTPQDVVQRMIDVYLTMVQRSPAIHEFVTTQAGLGWTRAEDDENPTASLGHFADHMAILLLGSLRSIPNGLNKTSIEDELVLDYWARAVVGMVNSVTDKWSRSNALGEGPPREIVVERLTQWILMPLQDSR